jgi:hypothetical protein
MKTLKFRIYFACIFILLIISCSKEDLSIKILKAENIEEASQFAEKAKKLGHDGIPIFLKVLRANRNKKYNVLTYGKVRLAIASLHDMAAEGIYSKEEVPTLLDAINEQISIDDTFPIAQTLRLITGIDVGYSDEFVKNYSEADEDKRQKMLSKWSEWYKNNS